MDEVNTEKKAVIFDWSGTLTFMDESQGYKEVLVPGAKELIAHLKEQDIRPFIATGGGFDAGMRVLGFDNSCVKFTGRDGKGIAVDELRAEGYTKIVYVGDSSRDVTSPATRGIPVIIFEPEVPNDERMQSYISYLKKQCNGIKADIGEADASYIIGIESLEAVIIASLERSQFPTSNRTVIRSIGERDYAITLARKFIEALSEITQKPIVDATDEVDPVSNVPTSESIVVSVGEFQGIDRVSYQIEVNYPLTVPSEHINFGVRALVEHLRTQEVFDTYDGFRTTTRLPDSARPFTGRESI